MFFPGRWLCGADRHPPGSIPLAREKERTRGGEGKRGEPRAADGRAGARSENEMGSQTPGQRRPE